MEDYLSIILDMQKRIIKLENEVEELKRREKTESSVVFQDRAEEFKFPKEEDKNDYMPNVSTRDKSRYLFNGKVYLKNRLVLAIVKDYVANNQSITCNVLKSVFEKSLQGSLGVVEFADIARVRCSDYQNRFFTEEKDVLRLSDGIMYVCSQWGILNIPNFIVRARQLGYEIEKV